MAWSTVLPPNMDTERRTFTWRLISSPFPWRSPVNPVVRTTGQIWPRPK